MPRVPQAEGFGQVLPAVRQERAQPVLSLDMAALPGRQMQEAGRASMAIGQAIGDFALKEQEKVNKARLNDAYNQAERLAQDLRVKMKQLQGVDAASGIDNQPLDQYFDNELKRGLSAIADNLQAPVVREQFSLLADDMSTRFRNEAVTHMAQQTEVYNARVLDDTITTSMNLIAANPGNTFAEKWNLTRAKDALRTKYDNAGFNPEQIDLRLKEDLGKSHAVIIEGLVDSGQVMQAKAYFERNRDDFTATDAKTVETKLQKSASALQALTDADIILADIPFSKGTFNYKDGYAAARKMAGDDVVRLEAIMGEINKRFNYHKEQYAGEYANDIDRVYALAMQSPASAMASPAFQRLKAKDQAQILNMANGEITDRVRNQMDVTYGNLAYGDPNVLASMSDNTFRMLRISIGDENYAKLEKRRDELRKDPLAKDRMNVDNSTFDFLLGELGIDAAAKKQVEPDTLFRLRDGMEGALTLERQRLGRAYLSPDEMSNVILNNWSATTVLQNSINSLRTIAGVSAPPVQAIEPIASTTFVRVPSPAGFVNIPQDDYTEIMYRFSQLGETPTPADIIANYNRRLEKTR